MNLTNVTVNPGAPLPIQPGAGAQAPALCVRNVGAVPVFLGTSSLVSTATGRRLSPGSSLNWSSGSPLYVCSDTVATIDIYDSTGAEFNPQAIADSLTASGLALSIANQIKIAGSPTIFTATNLGIYTNNYVYWQGAGATITTSGCAFITMVTSSSDGADIIVQQSSINGPTFSREYGLQAGGNERLCIPTCGDCMTVTAFTSNGDPSASSLTIWFYGSSLPLPDEYATDCLINLGTGVTSTGSVAAGQLCTTYPTSTGTWRSYIPHNGKPIQVVVSGGVGSYIWYARGYAYGTGTDYRLGASSGLPGGGTVEPTFQLVPPARTPLIFSVTRTTNAALNVTYLYNR